MLIVAANNASAASQARADSVCDGVADDVEINAAIGALPATGDRVILTEGTFNISASITIPPGITLEGPADKAGIKPGDVVVRINSRLIKNGNDAVSAFGSVLAGETFSIDVLRKDEELRLSLVAAEAE